jgi:alginate O-acetyltransferase complex protein AlgI
MLFNSLLFLVFLTIVFFANWVFPGRYRWVVLLIASIVFYIVATPAYLGVLAISVAMNYYLGIRIDTREEEKQRSNVLKWGIILNVLFLAGFKYGSTVISLPVMPFQSFKDWELTRWLVPLGISFYTFTTISYLIEVKRRHAPAERHFGYFSLYVTFFPKLIMGPIERPQNFLPQVREPKPFDYNRATDGLRLMLWGFFKKLVIADRLALAVNPVFDNPSQQSGPAIIVAAVFYSIQIYADFSGYIDIARGAAKLLGFDLSKNFNRPYASTSIKDFWTRWHITLSNWLRDYLFLPIAFWVSRKLKKQSYLGIRTDDIIYTLAISVTFIICGIWHGVGWTYFTWGALFAFYLTVGHLTEKVKRIFYKKTGLSTYKLPIQIFQIIMTFALVTMAWIVFRANSYHDIIVLISGAFHGWSDILTLQVLKNAIIASGPSTWGLFVIIFNVPLMFLVEYVVSNSKYIIRIQASLPIIRWGIYYFILGSIVLFGPSNGQEFMYYKF